MSFDCCYIAGRCDHPECGAYPFPLQRQPAPTEAEYCASTGHPYHGDHEDRGRCYCGQMEYPLGGPVMPDRAGE